MSLFKTLPLNTIQDYYNLLEIIYDLPKNEQRIALREGAQQDLFFLLWHLCGRDHLEHEWSLARCKEVQEHPDGYLDLWSREHGKTSVITFGKTIQDILNNPEITVGIFSHTRPIAKSFLRQIMRELENNVRLKQLFPDILYANPRQHSPKWNEDEGIVVIRKGNPVESTIEAWGMVDGMPTGRHFKLRLYDDVVTLASVSNRDQINKTTEAWELSDNLGSIGGAVRMIGTRYSTFDTYSIVLERKAAIPRIYPATENGRMDGRPVLFTQQEWERRLRTQSRQTVASQLLQNPLADEEATFKIEWLRPYEVVPRVLNVAILCDPSKGLNEDSDNTAISVIGVSMSGAKYLLDGYCHHMSLSQRWIALRDLHKYWEQRIAPHGRVEVGYEQYGMVSDDEYFTEQMQREKYIFTIEKLAWTREGTKGEQGKRTRVERLEPDFRNGRFFLPLNVWRDGKACTWEVQWSGDKNATGRDRGTASIVWKDFVGLTKMQQSAMDGGAGEQVCKAIKRYNEDRRIYDLTLKFIEEYQTFPFGRWKDLIDSVSRLSDLDLLPPTIMRRQDTETQVYWDS